MDTDSVMFTNRPGQEDPPLGDYLGEFTSECDDGDFTEFASAGPKNYGYLTSLGYRDPTRQHHIDDYIAQGSRKIGTDRHPEIGDHFHGCHSLRGFFGSG